MKLQICIRFVLLCVMVLLVLSGGITMQKAGGGGGTGGGGKADGSISTLRIAYDYDYQTPIVAAKIPTDYVYPIAYMAPRDYDYAKMYMAPRDYDYAKTYMAPRDYDYAKTDSTAVIKSIPTDYDYTLGDGGGGTGGTVSTKAIPNDYDYTNNFPSAESTPAEDVPPGYPETQESQSTTPSKARLYPASADTALFSDRDVAKALYNNLLEDYDVRVRPIQNQSKPIYVNTKFVPISIIEFDTSEQTFAVLGYFRVRWIDETMVWQPRDWNYISTVKVPTTALWKPNVIIHKATDGQGEIGNSETDMLVVNWNGNVQWVPEGIYTVVCNVDISNFPFDVQTCVFTFYVADESTKTVTFDHYLTVDMSEYTENAAWIVTSVSRQRVVRNNNYYVDIEFRLQRRANFALLTLIAPLMALAFLNISVFLVPVESGEKGSFSITIFLSYGVFITIITDTLPNNSAQTSVFVVLIETLLCLSVLSVVYTVIQARIAFSIGHKRCPIQCLKTLKNRNQVAPIENGGMPPQDRLVYTWKMFLNQLDSVLFFVFLVAIMMIIGFSSRFFFGTSAWQITMTIANRRRRRACFPARQLQVDKDPHDSINMHIPHSIDNMHSRIAKRQIHGFVAES